MDILGYSSYRWLPSTLYLLLLLVLSLKPKAQEESWSFTALVKGVVFLILLVHGVVLYDSVFTEQGFVFGFAQDLSLVAWVGLTFYWFQSWFLPISSLRWLTLLFAMICAVLPCVFSGGLISPKAVSDPWFKAHFVVAAVSVGLLSLAAMHALLMSLQDSALHRHPSQVPTGRAAQWLEELPPLMTMESLLFNLLYAGFTLLTLTVFSGLFFSQALFDRPLVFDHKTIFALVSWSLFAGLLVARWRVGLRGRTALRWILSAYVALLLAYAGSRFVMEVILHRT
ncbi:ABC-type uncharacterized transport system, permease component [Polynucleobacter meluiroseus]|uniref:ABC-type uncharacterized transport system, permease component n=1 Tax=Polynucleobacter meluiroseus TaxID=1938814 RepID=A0A240E195_9BURK|nr:cytochrome c biogenesis protein CcsA [Polynucleobacter meluiroseus]SNX28997.1 ABC-type uncharacterized transport system, permease component [Polynucleobacter meluiroseus]